VPTGSTARSGAGERAALAACRGYVSNERAASITVIDTCRDVALDTVQVNGRPRGFHVSADGRRLYVALADRDRAAEGREDGIIAFALPEMRPLLRFEAGSDPEQFALTPDGTRLFASNEDAGTATAADTRSGRALATLVVGIEPEGVAISPDGRWVYVTAETSSTVSVIDARRLKVVASFLVDPRPRAAAFAPDGRPGVRDVGDRRRRRRRGRGHASGADDRAGRARGAAGGRRGLARRPHAVRRDGAFRPRRGARRRVAPAARGDPRRSPAVGHRARP
jgi:YVTN family beta-propeller protein